MSERLMDIQGRLILPQASCNMGDQEYLLKTDIGTRVFLLPFEKTYFPQNEEKLIGGWGNFQRGGRNTSMTQGK